MATITNYFEEAQLSLAAYAFDLQAGMSSSNQTSAYIDKLKFAGMSDAQATKFSAAYTVVDQFTDPATGFSGTVFSKGGAYYFALRGTEGFDPTDWATNFGDIGADGIAIAQGVALSNWLQRLMTPAGSPAQQFKYVPEVVDDDMGVFIPASIIAIDPVASLGYLSGASGFTVAGHSMGGHLAMLMSRLAPSLVGSVYTYNAPGFDPILVSPGSSGFFDLLRTAAGTPVTGPIGTGWNGNSMSHLNVPGDIVSGVGNTPGNEQTLFSESANQEPLDAHDKVPLTNALALAWGLAA